MSKTMAAGRRGHFDRLRAIGHFDKLSSFDGLRMHGHFDKLSANGGCWRSAWELARTPPVRAELVEACIRHTGHFDRLSANGGSWLRANGVVEVVPGRLIPNPFGLSLSKPCATLSANVFAAMEGPRA